MNDEEAAETRKKLWNIHYAKVKLDINDWAELTEELDNIILDLGVEDLLNP